MNGKPTAIRLFIFSALGLLLEAPLVQSRDPLKQPFRSQSIWNMPIGSGAVYVPANIQKATDWGMTVDEDLIVMTPDSSMTEIYHNGAGWDRNKNRCPKEGKLLMTAPIPKHFVVGPQNWDGATPNSGLAVLMPDRRTVKQTQPFARCTAGDYGTSQYVFPDADLYGDGITGAHGGSGLSAIGGTLRLGELAPGAGPIRHALKVNLYAAVNCYYDAKTPGFRWPAVHADGYAAGVYGTKGKPVKACVMGSLLALPAGMKLDSLGFETEPARMLAQAFQDYGAYLVDDTYWSVYAVETEWSPEGRVKDEFKRVWGFEISPNSRNTRWARDMDRIFTNLHVVDNNGPASIGGGGTPRAPLADPIDPAGADPSGSPVRSFQLNQNYPNPFNQETRIRYHVSSPVHVRLDVFDMQGRRVAVLVDGDQATGRKEISFSGRDLASGVYCCRLAASNQVQTLKMLLMK